MNGLTCETCAHWRVQKPGDVSGDCAINAVYNPVRFDYAPCALHSAHVQAPTLDQQSQACGLDMKAWQAKISGAK